MGYKELVSIFLRLSIAVAPIFCRRRSTSGEGSSSDVSSTSSSLKYPEMQLACGIQVKYSYIITLYLYRSTKGVPISLKIRAGMPNDAIVRPSAANAPSDSSNETHSLRLR